MVDALGNLVNFVPLPGQRHDLIGVDPLLDGVEFETLPTGPTTATPCARSCKRVMRGGDSPQIESGRGH